MSAEQMIQLLIADLAKAETLLQTLCEQDSDKYDNMSYAEWDAWNKESLATVLYNLNWRKVGEPT